LTKQILTNLLSNDYPSFDAKGLLSICGFFP
jgi:hypothetical protein